MYKVLHYFTDLTDNNYAYHAGDIFPRDGITVADERFAELSGKKNNRKMPLIEEVDKPASKKGGTKKNVK